MKRWKCPRETFESSKGAAELGALLASVSATLTTSFGASAGGSHAALLIATITVLSVITLSVVGYWIHMLVLGGSTKKQVKRAFQSRIIPLEQLIDEAKANIWRFESALESGTTSISPHCITLVTTLRRIVLSADNHLRLVRKLSENGSHSQLLVAEEKLTAPVPMRDNCLEALIDEDPLPHRPLEAWVPHICSLIDEIDHGINHRIAA